MPAVVLGCKHRFQTAIRLSRQFHQGIPWRETDDCEGDHKKSRYREKSGNAQGVMRRCTLKSASRSIHHASTDHPAPAASE